MRGTGELLEKRAALMFLVSVFGRLVFPQWRFLAEGTSPQTGENRISKGEWRQLCEDLF